MMLEARTRPGGVRVRARDLRGSDQAGASYWCLSCNAVVYLAAYLRPAEEGKQRPHFRLKKHQAHEKRCTEAGGPAGPERGGGGAAPGSAIEVLDLRLFDSPDAGAPGDDSPLDGVDQPRGGQGGGLRARSLKRICQAHFDHAVAYDMPLRVVGVDGLAETTFGDAFRPLRVELGVGTRIWFGVIFQRRPPSLKRARGVVRLIGSGLGRGYQVFTVRLAWEDWSAQARSRLARDLRQAFESTARLLSLERPKSSPVQERHPRVYFIGQPSAAPAHEFHLSDPRYICVIQGSGNDGEVEIEMRRE
jgi:hypothetical protein